MFSRAKRFFRGEPKTEAELLRIIRFEMGALGVYPPDIR
jgi:hypothetical protein